MTFNNFDPLGDLVMVEFSLQELAVLYSALVDTFGRMTENSPFWKETEKACGDLSEIIKKASAEKERYDECAKM